MLKDKQILLEEIRVAVVEWQHAQQRLDYMVEKDQIDYAIYALEAAEKRYEMLLRSAKKMNIHALHIGMGRAAEG